MDGRIGRVFKLLRNPGIRGFFGQCLGPGDRALHAFRAGRQDQFGAQHGQQGAAFERHRFGHGEDELVAFGRRHEREGDAGVAAGWLDDDGVLLEDAALLGVLNHGHADAVLDAAEGIEKFAFECDGGRQAGGDFVQFDQRRVADGFDDVVVNASHNFV